jgi:carbon storage regulator
MLVLSRRRDESIMIGDDVEITIVDVRGDVVKLGVRAPRAVAVHRKEIYETIQRENVAAAQASQKDFTKALQSLRKGAPKTEQSKPSDDPK